MFKDKEGNFSLKKAFAAAVLGVSCLTGGVAAVDSVYVVDNSERAMIKTTGILQDGLIEPGLHFKVPFFQSVSEFTLTPQTKDYVKLSTGTQDSQAIWSDLKVVYEIPPESIPRLVSQPGWEARIEGVVVSRYKEVIGTISAIDIPANRAKISLELTTAIAKSAAEEIGIKVTDVQLVNYDLDPALLANLQEIANRKAQVEQARQDKAKAEVEAQTKKIIAEGEAQKVIAQAFGDAAATTAKADANAYATKLNGEALAAALKIQLSAVGDPNILVLLANADAWKSGGAQMPDTLVTGGNTTTLVSPATDAAKKAASVPTP